MVLLRRQQVKNTLQRISIQRRLGILYIEYQDKNYYWELTIILFKIIIVVLTS